MPGYDCRLLLVLFSLLLCLPFLVSWTYPNPNERLAVPHVTRIHSLHFDSPMSFSSYSSTFTPTIANFGRDTGYQFFFSLEVRSRPFSRSFVYRLSLLTDFCSKEGRTPFGGGLVWLHLRNRKHRQTPRSMASLVNWRFIAAVQSRCD